MSKLKILLKFSIVVLFGGFQANSAFSQNASFFSNRGFITPSKNITCMAYGGTLRCDIGINEAPIPPKPSDCEFDWGGSFIMGLKGKPRRGCVSDAIVSPDHKVLPYGKTWNHDGFTCKSAIDGLTCWNRSKKGWFINKVEQKFF